jgi:hypothetical protein
VHKLLVIGILYWDILNCLYFADTTERRDRGWKEAQREGENRVTLQITLWCVWGVFFLLYCVGLFFLAPSTLMLSGDVSETLAIMVSKVLRGGLLETSGVVRKPYTLLAHHVHFGCWSQCESFRFFKANSQSSFVIVAYHCGGLALHMGTGPGITSPCRPAIWNLFLCRRFCAG